MPLDQCVGMDNCLGTTTLDVRLCDAGKKGRFAGRAAVLVRPIGRLYRKQPFLACGAVCATEVVPANVRYTQGGQARTLATCADQSTGDDDVTLLERARTAASWGA